MNMRLLFILIFGFCLFTSMRASHQFEFFTADFFINSNSSRSVYDMNRARQLYKGKIQGEEWHRKSFIPDEALVGKKVFFHFEAIMEKSKIYINGKFEKRHYSRHLLVIVCISDDFLWSENHVISRAWV